jgi:hypothetical protein
MSTTTSPDRFISLPDKQTLASAVTALEEHGFSVEVAENLGAAREAVLARIPHGSSVMTNTSVTLAETGIADAINDGGPYESARNAMFALGFATQAQEMRVIGAQKLVPTLEAAHQRIYQHILKLGDARAMAAYGQHSQVGKILEMHQELPGRIHIVLVRQVAGF